VLLISPAIRDEVKEGSGAAALAAFMEVCAELLQAALEQTGDGDPGAVEMAGDIGERPVLRLPNRTKRRYFPGRSPHATAFGAKCQISLAFHAVAD
jgi:hypothetical protein